jgi:hypothetical protein
LTWVKAPHTEKASVVTRRVCPFADEISTDRIAERGTMLSFMGAATFTSS